MLLALAEGMCGQPVRPVDAAYLYYQSGSYCGLHTDRSEFNVQLRVTVLGDVGPLLIHPDLADMPVEELARRCELDGPPADGIEIRYPRTGVTMIRGTSVPHQRPVHRGARPAVVAGLNYGITL